VAGVPSSGRARAWGLFIAKDTTQALETAIGLWFVSLIGYSQYLQRGYIHAWHLQQDFWYQIVSLVPEGGPGWTVIVTGTPAVDPVIAANSWADLLVYRQVYGGAYDPAGPNFAHIGVLGSLVQFRRTQDGVVWKPNFWGGHFEPIDPHRLALLQSDRGHLTRVSSIDTPVGRLTSPAPLPGPHFPRLPKRPVSQLLFSNTSSEP